MTGRLPLATVGAVVVLAAAQGLALAETSYRLPAALAVVLALLPVLVGVLPSAAGQAVAKWSALRVQMRWWHGLWVVIFLSGLVFRIRDSRDIAEAPVDGWALYRMALVGLTGVILAIRLAGGNSWWRSLWQGGVGLLAAYTVFGVVSATWSVFPTWTLYKSSEYLVDLALLAAALHAVRSTQDLKSLLDLTWALFAGLLGLVWLGAVMWPEEALMQGVGLLGYQLHGVVPAVAQNEVGEYAALLALVAIQRLQRPAAQARGRMFYGVLVVFSLATMILAQTRSAIIGFGIGLSLLLLANRHYPLLVCTLLVASLAGVMGGKDVAWKYMQRGQSAALNMNLTGRVIWWEFALRKWSEKPLVGHGAYAGGRWATLAAMGETMNSQMHSTWVEMLVGTGLCGLTLVVLLLLRTGSSLVAGARRFAPDSVERQLAVELLAILGLISFRSFVSSYLIWHGCLHFLAVVGGAEFLRRR